MPAIKKEVKEQRIRGKELAGNIEGYLNQLEEILSKPMGVDEKAEAFNQISLLVGKLMVSFADFENNYNVFDYNYAEENR